MASHGLQEDLSVLTHSEGCWWYKSYRIQADPNAHRFAVRYLPKTNAKRVLDLGSGTGALPAQLRDAGFCVSSTSWNGQCQVGDVIYELNLDNGFCADQVGAPYDAITAIDVIEHLENPWALMRSIGKALTNDGVALVSTPNLESARSRLEWLLKGETQDFTAEQIRYNRHISPIGRSAFSAMAEQAGLRIIERHHFGRYVRNGRLKQRLFLLAEKLLPEHSGGTTTLYVLTPSGSHLNLGPDHIY